MGVSTDALLLYGIPIEEDSIPEYDEGVDPEEGPSYMVYSGDAVDGIVIERHCSNEYPMYFAAIAGQTTRAWRGSAKPVTGKDLSQNIEWDRHLKAFLKEHGLKSNGKPGWYLASDWG